MPQKIKGKIKATCRFRGNGSTKKKVEPFIPVLFLAGNKR